MTADHPTAATTAAVLRAQDHLERITDAYRRHGVRTVDAVQAAALLPRRVRAAAIGAPQSRPTN